MCIFWDFSPAIDANIDIRVVSVNGRGHFHHKFVVADGGTGEGGALATGSANWLKKSLSVVRQEKNNVENMLLFTPLSGSPVPREFARHFLEVLLPASMSLSQ